MVYEYCDEIKNSGINMNAFPDSCTSFMEMGLYIAESTIREVDNIFHEAGLVELEKFRNNTITEAAEEGITKTVLDKVKKAFVKLFEGFKRAWGKLNELIMRKIDEYNKRIGDRFEKLDLSKYKKSIDSYLNSETLTIINLSKTEEMEKDLLDAKNKAKEKLSGTEELTFDKALAVIIDEMSAGSVPINNIEDAKKFITDTMRKEAYKDVDSSTVIIYKKEIIDIIKNKAKSAVNAGYKEAKKSIDDSIKNYKALEKSEDNGLKQHSLNAAKLETAYQTLLLQAVGQTVKDALNSCLTIAMRCIQACRPGNEDDKILHASAKFDTKFVNQAFNS